MGFALFDQSGTFNPLDYGLSVGDRLEVMCVGGGGGGGTTSGGNPYGGNGGPSSFGSYITALGGYGCSNNSSSTAAMWRGTPTQYMTKGCCSNGNNFSGTPGFYFYGGGGGGGWWYDAVRTDAYPMLFIQNGGSGSQYCEYLIPIDMQQHGGTGGRAGFGSSIYSNYTPYTKFDLRWPKDNLWTAFIQYLNNSQCTGCFIPNVPVAGGTSWFNYDSYNSMLETYPTHQSARNYQYGTGGIGYGAGGGSYCSSTNYRPGGCGGELRRASVIIDSMDTVVVSVGGGGAGGCCYHSGSSWTVYNGNDGAAGAAGAASIQYGCPGGYGTMIPAPKQSINNSSYRCQVGGGGAGGCVAIWW